MRTWITTAPLVLFGLSSWAASAWADEEEIALDKVPAAVMTAVKQKFPTAQIEKAEKEVEDGKTIFEIGLEDAGQAVDVSLEENGTILEVEKEVDAEDLPKEVRDALKKTYPEGEIEKAEVVTKGEETTYEVVVEQGEKTREVVLDAKGKILEDEEDDEDGDK